MSERGWQELHEFWFGELPDETSWPDDLNKRWYMGGEELDREIERRFGDWIEAAANGELDHWKEETRGQLCLIVLFDQFTRNVFRGSGDAFKYDELARELALDLIDSGRKDELYPIEQVLVFMPLEHSEDIGHQQRCVELFKELTEEVPEEIADTFVNFTDYAVKHHDIIATFGRFPHRNALLDRAPTPEEETYLEEGGATFGQTKTKKADD